MTKKFNPSVTLGFKSKLLPLRRGFEFLLPLSAQSSKFVICVVLLLIVMLYVLFMCKCVLPPGVNPTADDKYINININININT
jgi:hypothetical protein